MSNTTKNEAKSLRDISYYSQRYRNRVFSKLVSFIAEQCKDGGITKKDIAERLNKDPALISRWLSQPSNLTLDTISELLVAFDAEAEPPEIVLFKDRREPNFIHPLMARVLNRSGGASVFKPSSVGEANVTLPSNSNVIVYRPQTTTAD